MVEQANACKRLEVERTQSAIKLLSGDAGAEASELCLSRVWLVRPVRRFPSACQEAQKGKEIDI